MIYQNQPKIIDNRFYCKYARTVVCFPFVIHYICNICLKGNFLISRISEIRNFGMIRLVLKYWWMLPILLCACVVGLIFLFTTVHPIIEGIVGILLLLVIVLLLISWVTLLINKKWCQCLISLVISVTIIIMLWFPLVMAAMSGQEEFDMNHKIPKDWEAQYAPSPD